MRDKDTLIEDRGSTAASVAENQASMSRRERRKRRVTARKSDAESGAGHTVPPADVAGSARRHPGLIAVSGLLVLALAVLLSLGRAPVYSAETRLLVGDSQSVDPQALQSLGVATEQLAATYSRLITSDQVLAEVNRRTGITPAEASETLTASPIPETAVIRIEASGTTSARAREVADAAAVSLREFVVNDDAASDTALEEYQSASVDYSALVLQRDARRGSVQRLAASIGTNPTAAEQTRLDTARLQLAQIEGQVATAQLRVQTLEAGYTTSQRGGGGTDVVRIVQAAQSLGSDRAAQLQRNALLGLVGGLLLGLGAAVLIDRRRSRKAIPR